MKEARFIKLRKSRWQEIESDIQSKAENEPDELAERYIEISDDLAYSQTFYPKSKTSGYLNELALYFHRRIYKNKKEDRGRFKRYWLNEIPETMYRARWSMLAALVLFLLAVLIGSLSMYFNPDFPRLILGDAYVDLTLQNIENGDPMGIYGMRGEGDMFTSITFNNIKVAFLAFVLGFFSPIGPGSLLLRNGIMLGSFQTFFLQQGLFGISAQGIWIHGTIEITAIVVAGGAGIHLSSGFLFPGNFTRIERFKQSAKEGMKIVIGLVPFFIIAGFLEGFVTRYYQNPSISIPIIILSLGLVFWYFIYLPYMTHKFKENEREN